MELEILKIWPDWEATRLIGEGSFGKVYEIVRNNFGIEEHCALKVISIPSSQAELQSMKNEGMDDASATEYYRGLVEEFVQEIALMSKLKGNVNVVGYEDYAVIEHKDSIGWDIIIRMELLTALPDYIKNNSFNTPDIIKLGIDICNALEVCHEQRIIHRDIKPDNIFVSANGDYKLGDFGVARTIEKTVSGLSKKGTYTYMAPEVYKGLPYGTNVDLYSLGIVMYKLLNNNREPFLPPHPELIKYSDKSDALVRRLNGEIIPPPANADQQLSNIILKACDFRSGERYQKPSQMKTDLQATIGIVSTNATPILQADHMAASATYKSGQSVVNSQSFASSFSQNNVGQGTANNVFVFGTNSNNTFVQGTPVNNQPKKSNNILRILALVFGWIGVPLWLLMSTELDTAVLVMTLIVAIAMILLSIKPLEKLKLVFSIVMLVFSVFSINIFNLTSAILFMCIKKKQ